MPRARGTGSLAAGLCSMMQFVTSKGPSSLRRHFQAISSGDAPDRDFPSRLHGTTGELCHDAAKQAPRNLGLGRDQCPSWPTVDLGQVRAQAVATLAAQLKPHVLRLLPDGCRGRRTSACRAYRNNYYYIWVQKLPATSTTRDLRRRRAWSQYHYSFAPSDHPSIAQPA